jgi:hypothetical protein
MKAEQNGTKKKAINWIRFLRGYGPVPKNENMYDELIRSSAERLGVEQLAFAHPASERVLAAIGSSSPTSVVLTGTAGDGKTYLCRQVWEALGGDSAEWRSENPLLSMRLPKDTVESPYRVLHVIRDLSAWAPVRGTNWRPDREALLQRFANTLFEPKGNSEIFLIAANDGQLMDSWHRLQKTTAIVRAGEILETMLVEDSSQLSEIALCFLNLSRQSSADLFNRALDALLAHPGWGACSDLNATAGEFFGPECPIRRNVETLGTTLVRTRLCSLMELCDFNQVHIPIRQILLLLSNAILGHPDAKDGLLAASDVPEIIRRDTVAKASVYNNIFGGNLPESRRSTRLVFNALERFGIGKETTNRIDNVLIFGDADESLRPYFERFLLADRFYGADASFLAAQRDYIEGADDDDEKNTEFLGQLISQRRALFFKIPEGEAADLQLWQLTVFSYAGEYLTEVISRLKSGREVARPIVSRMAKGLNRVFTGMLVSDDRDLLLATSLTVSDGRVSRLLEDRVSVDARRGDYVKIVMHDSIADGAPVLETVLAGGEPCILPLYLTRFEFLSRVAAGALPSSFSKECYEDMLAYKTRLLASLSEARARSSHRRDGLSFQLLSLDDSGKATVVDLEVRGG